ncbi:MAG: metallophosphoesterase [Nocardiaceae bacterium]|nr:metallophosphoesterase [Nocardiaceae bacterium]
MRTAAVGDIHFGDDSHGVLRPALLQVKEHAEVLFLAGDLTRHGTADEARVVAEEFSDIGVPVVAVLGNHDYHNDEQDLICELLREHGISVLEGESTVISVNGGSLAVAGLKGFGGGFSGACASPFGERQMKLFAGHTVDLAHRLAGALDDVAGNADATVVLMHYSPVPDTLVGEPLEIYPFLGSYLFAEVIDQYQVDLVLHGHAHAGTRCGVTPGGIPVRNVAQPVIQSAYAVFGLHDLVDSHVNSPSC